MSTWQEKAVQEAAEAIDNLTHSDTTLNGDWLESVAQATVAALAPVVEAEVRRGQAEAWGDGFDAGHETSRAVNNEWPRMPRSPYAIEAGDPR